jgi:CDP-paratose 2-epimerase
MASSRRVLVTGSSGLIGSETVTYFEGRGWEVHGVDNNMRRDFFGPDGDTTWNLERLLGSTRRFVHHDLDIRDRQAVLALTKTHRPDLIVHCAAQPSHDLAKDRPFDDFDVNAVGTLNLLESARHGCPDAPFVFMSTNKVYGDAPNDMPLVELETRWEYARPEDYHGVSETCRLDRCVHSLLGASKLAADVLVQALDHVDAHAVEDGAAARDFLADQLRVIVHALVLRRCQFEFLGDYGDGAERRAQLVRGAGGEGRERRELIAACRQVARLR